MEIKWFRVMMSKIEKYRTKQNGEKGDVAVYLIWNLCIQTPHDITNKT